MKAPKGSLESKERKGSQAPRVIQAPKDSLGKTPSAPKGTQGHAATRGLLGLTATRGLLAQMATRAPKGRRVGTQTEGSRAQTTARRGRRRQGSAAPPTRR